MLYEVITLGRDEVAAALDAAAEAAGQRERQRVGIVGLPVARRSLAGEVFVQLKERIVEGSYNFV